MYDIKFQDIVKECNEQIRDAVKQCKSKEELLDYFKGVGILPLKNAAKNSIEGINADEIPKSKTDVLSWYKESINIIDLPDTFEQMNPSPVSQENELETNIPETQKLTDEPVYSIERLNQFFQYFSKNKIKSNQLIEDVTSLKLTKSLPVEYHDDFTIVTQEKFYEKLVVLGKYTDESENFSTVACGRLQACDCGYRILFETQAINYEEFENFTCFKLLLFTREIEAIFNQKEIKSAGVTRFNGVVYETECSVQLMELRPAVKPLCIDFGTSNTSAGSYGILSEDDHQIELVRFTDVNDAMKEKALYPSVVYVADCSDCDNLKFLFGYEAQKRVREQQFDTKASAFFDIKRWMETIDDDEVITDERGKKQIVKRRVIIKAYILDVIEKAQKYFKRSFKRLHFSAPAKLMELFNREFKEMFETEEKFKVLDSNETLDEGVSIVYNSVRKLIERNQITANEKKNILIIDCGGGTTDLASCTINLTELDVEGYRIGIKTKFVSGNANFGGNNITYRLLQLIKIKFAEQIARLGNTSISLEKLGDCSIQELIDADETSILNKIDAIQNELENNQIGTDQDFRKIVYKKFEEKYNLAESIIPTRFAEITMQEKQKRIKRNFYYLWQLAEQIKIDFYANERVQIGGADQPLKVDPTGYFVNYYNKANKLERQELGTLEPIRITVNELHRLLCGDIFGLMNEIFLLKRDEIDTYNFYRLSGQSCKINLFMELFKEFVPGRKLRQNKVAAEARSNESELFGGSHLKIDCISGSIAYLRDRHFGRILSPDTDDPDLIYDVYVDDMYVDHSAKKKKLIISKDKPSEIKVMARSKDTERIRFIVRNRVNQQVNDFTIGLKFPEGEIVSGDIAKLEEDVEEHALKTVSPDSIEKLFEEIRELDPKERVGDDNMKLVFAVPSKEGYGMNVYYLGKSKVGSEETYYWNKKTHEYRNFESGKLSFFDGRK